MEKKGVTFLLAVIISSLALSLGLGVSFVVLEELKLSGTGKESFVAFFAADSGAECALFWDLERNKFSTTTPGTINCNGNDYSVGGSLVSSFDLDLGARCAKVTVNKSQPFTRITSLGQNVSCSAPVGARKVQRGIEITY